MGSLSTCGRLLFLPFVAYDATNFETEFVRRMEAHKAGDPLDPKTEQGHTIVGGQQRMSEK